MNKTLFDPMIEIAYCDCLYDIKHLSIFGMNAEFEEKFSNIKFKIRLDKFKELLQANWESLKSFEKIAKDNKLGNDCYIDAYLNGEHIFIPLYYYNKDLNRDVIDQVDRFIKVKLNHFLSLCRYCAITSEDIEYEIEDEIKAMAPNAEFSMRELFAKRKDLIFNLKDACAIHSKVLEYLKNKIEAIDTFGDKFVKLEEDNTEWDNPFAETQEEFLKKKKQELKESLSNWDKFVDNVKETNKTKNK